MMPAKRLRLESQVFTLVAVLLLVPAGVEAQTGSVTMKGTVSEVVALSVLPDPTHGNVETSGNTVRITLAGANSDPLAIHVPLLVRSNSSFKITATAESSTTEVTQLSVLNVRATGTLVSPNANSELNVPRQFDVRAPKDSIPLDTPVLIASGPRVSRGGTLTSPNNALLITLLIHLKPQPGRGWLVHLTFVGTAGSPIQ